MNFNCKILLHFCGLLRKPELYKNDEVFMSHFVVIMTQVKWAVLHCSKKSQLYNTQFSSVFREDFVGVKENVLDRIGRDMCSDWRLCSVVADLTFSGAASTGSAIYYNKKSLHDGLLLFVCLLVTEATPFWITREARPIPYNIELCPEESS